MRSVLLRFSVAVICLICFSDTLFAQINTGLNGTVINLLCGQNCVTQPLRIPHLKSTSDYAVIPIAYNPYSYVTAVGTEDPNIYNDDKYSPMFDLPFSFCFYDSVFTKVSVGSNGVITFDYGLLNCDLANLGAAWDVTNAIPFNSNQGTCSGTKSNYPRAAIMGIFQDLDPRPGPTSPTVSSPPGRKIEWRVEGTAPFRRFIVSYYKIGVFEATTCGLETPATFQIVIYESTGVIDIFVENKACNSTGGDGNENRAILGIQNWTRDKGVAAPGKNAVPWTASNEAYRFVPSGPPSRFVRCELQTLNHTFIALGDTVTTTPGLLDVTFPSSFCPTVPSSQYVIKSIYSACDNPANQIISYDTITVNKTTALNATQSTTQTGCGLTGTGTATMSVPAGIGTAPYTFVLSPGGTTLTGNSPQQFTNLTAGGYSVLATDAGGGCSSTLPFTITSTGVLAVTYNVTNTSCPGASNGSIVVNPPNGTPPITYSINGGLPITNNSFSGLTAATYFITTRDAAGCTKSDNVTIAQGTNTVAGTATPTPTTCAGINNGSIAMTPSGSGPFEYSINNGATWQTSNIFSGLAPGSYNILIKEAGVCTSAPIPSTITAGIALQAGITPSSATCTGATNGTITVTMNSGTAPFTFVLDGITTQTSAGNSTIFNAVPAGLHSVTVTDVNSCTTTAPLTTTVAAGAGFTATFNPTPTGCAGASDGKLAITSLAPGTTPFTIVLNPGAITQTGTNLITFNNLAAGTYSALVTDASGCQFTLSNMNVPAGAGLIATPTPVPTSCSGANNGSISINMGSGAAPYTAIMDGTVTQTSATNIISFTNISAGPHSITITDANGCITTTPVTTTVLVGTGFTSTYTPTPTGCAGVNNGKLAINSPTGTAPFTIVLNPGAITQTGTNLITFNNLAAGTYSALVTDANGCQFTLSNMNVTSGAGLIATPTPVPTSCSGANNGSISINMGSGAAPYTAIMDGTVTQTSATNIISFTNISAGAHSITVTDVNGCVTSTPVTTTVPVGTGFTSTYTPTPTGCAGVNNGKLAINSPTGTAPFTIILNPGAMTQTGTNLITFNNLAAGTYNAVVTDANGCQFTLSNMNVTSGAGLVVTPTPVPTSCSGANNGSISINMGSGTAPYTAIMDGTVTQTSATNIISFTNISAGPHSITVTDANGCVTTTPVTTTVPVGTGFTSTYTPTPTGCVGVNDGKLAINSPTGSAPFTIILNPGSITQTGTNLITFNNLAAGTYNAVVTDANGCQFTLSNMNVTSGAGLIATPIPVPTSCSGANNGSISINMGSGAAPYTAIMDGTVTQTSATNTISFINISAGAHSITVTDANGCITSTPVTTTVPVGTGFTSTYTPTPTGCVGVNDGKLAINSPAGTAPFTIILNPGAITQTGANLITFNNLAAGTYNAVVTDANGCQFTLSNMNVASGAGLVATPTPVPTSCSGVNNGSVSLNMGSGAAPYTAIMDGTVTQTSATNIISFINISAGPHSITVTDANGCITTTPVTTTVPVGTGFTATSSTSPVLCAGGSTGSITVTTATGTSPFTFVLNGTVTQTAALTTIFNGLSAGMGNNVIVTDAVGCTFTLNNVIVTEPAPLMASSSKQNVLCNNGNDGKIFIAATGGTAPYFYSLDNTTFQPGSQFNVIAGTYTVYVKDANGCTVPQPLPVNVAEPAVLTATFATTNATCDGGNDGTITVNSTGGVSPYQYAITGGTFQTSNNIKVSPGAYDITVKDVNGCTYPVAGIIVGLTNNLTLTPATDPSPICEGSSVQLQTITNATQFSWTPAIKLSDAAIPNPIASPSGSTLYIVTATLGLCSVNDSVLIAVMAAPVPDAGPAPPDGICYGTTYQLQGSGGVTYTWTPSSYLSSTSVYNPVVTPDKTVTYALSVTDANGCPSLIPDQVTVQVIPPIKVTTYPFDTVVYAGVQIPLLATSVGTDYVWTSVSGTTGLNNPNIPDPIATAPLTDGAVVIYQVTATTAAGCKGDGFVKIQVYKGPDIYVATAFTPNGDGKNETFTPFPVGIKKLNYFKVFNRWGQMLYSTTTLNKGWDGKLGGSEQPSGVYIWMAEGVTMDNKIISKQGTVILIR